MPNTPLGLYYPDASTNAGLVPVLGAMQTSVDAYLTGRAVSYATRAAMLAAIPTPTPGMLANTRDWNIWWSWTGAQWRHIGSPNFTNTTVRDAQIPQPLAGDLCSTETSPAKFWRYSGTSWISDPSDTGWMTITPTASWSPVVCEVRVIAGVAYVRGYMSGTLASGDNHIGTMPVGAWPADGGGTPTIRPAVNMGYIGLLNWIYIMGDGRVIAVDDQTRTGSHIGLSSLSGYVVAGT